MSELEERLIQLGLTSTESQVYLAGLSHTGIGVQELVKETGIKRPTVYHALETLGQKGLVAKKGTQARRIFHMTAPAHLERLLDHKISVLENQKTELASLVPLLASRMNSHVGEEVQVTQYDGIEGVKMVVEEALYCRDRHWDIIAPRTNFFSEFSKEYAKYYIETRKRRKISSRSLWEKSDDGTKQTPGAHSVSPQTIKERNPRYLPSVMHGQFQSVMILFDDKVALISSYKTLSAVLIQSTEWHNFMSTMFEGLWSVSEQP